MHDFDGETYEAPRDQIRLNRQIQRVWSLVCDGGWWTYERIARLTGDPTQSVSARLRDLRKPRFGAHQVDRRYVKKGLFEYKVTANSVQLEG